MTIKVYGAVTGGDELERAFKQLPKATGKAVLRRVLKKSAKPLVAATTSMVPVDDGNLRESITSSVKLHPSVRGARISKRTGTALYVGPSWPQGAHGHLVEFGTVKTSPQPFLRPAWDSTKFKVLDTIRDEIWAALAKSARTLARKAEKGTLSKAAIRTLSQR